MPKKPVAKKPVLPPASGKIVQACLDVCQICQNVYDHCRCAEKELTARQNHWSRRFKRWVKNYPFWKEIGLFALAICLWLVGMYEVFLSAPAGFPTGVVMRIRKGSTVAQVATDLAARRLIKYPVLFKVFYRLGGDGKIVAGDYRFTKRAGVFNIYRRLIRGAYGIEPTKILLVEGHSAREIAVLLDRSLPVFDREVFLAAAEKVEGYLFPDTYYIKPMDDENDIVNMMVNNFNQQMITLESAIGKSGHSRDEIITMASIIELEARTTEARQMVAGILWSRLKQGMKLQVDAVFPYIMNKYSLQLTQKDLQFDSPYNTYRYKGLPPGPVGNPGLESIRAALEPTKTKYLYYLSGQDGTMHYALTYKEHMKNRAKYIGN